MRYSRHMHQDATIFRRTGSDAFGGSTFANGKNIKSRWQDSNEQFKDAQGKEFIAKSVVYLAVAITQGDMLALGKDATQDDAHEVKAVYETRNLRNEITLTKAIL